MAGVVALDVEVGRLNPAVLHVVQTVVNEVDELLACETVGQEGVAEGQRLAHMEHAYGTCGETCANAAEV